MNVLLVVGSWLAIYLAWKSGWYRGKARVYREWADELQREREELERSNDPA